MGVGCDPGEAAAAEPERQVPLPVDEQGRARIRGHPWQESLAGDGPDGRGTADRPEARGQDGTSHLRREAPREVPATDGIGGRTREGRQGQREASKAIRRTPPGSAVAPARTRPRTQSGERAASAKAT